MRKSKTNRSLNGTYAALCKNIYKSILASNINVSLFYTSLDKKVWISAIICHAGSNCIPTDFPKSKKTYFSFRA